MNTSMTFDTKGLDASLLKITFNSSELRQIEAPGGEVFVQGMKQRAAVDTSFMKNEIKRHVVKETSEIIEDEIGSDAPYAIYQEYGTGIYAENGQGRKTPWVYRRKDGKFITTSGNRPHPFVRPTALEDKDKIIKAMQEKFDWMLKSKWK